MKTDVTVNGREARLEWNNSNEDYEYQVQWEGADGGHRQRASLLEAERGIYTVLVDGRSYEAKIVQGQEEWYVDISGRHYAVQTWDRRERRKAAARVAVEGRQNLKAAMPGKVVRVLAAMGDEVAAGQGLVVVEAMKMQNEVKAPRAGKVISMAAKEGSTVAAGEVLATIE